METRREALLKALFGGGYVGLRALATGIPAAVLSKPPRAWAQAAPALCADKARAQYVIVSSSAAGDPLNANVPGTYEFPDIAHAQDPSMAATTFQMGGKPVKAAQIWSTLPQWVLDRTCFFHHATLTNNHPNLPKVMRLMGQTFKQEMLPSILAKRLAPCFGSVQTEPVSVGAGDILSFEGRGLPNLNPTGLRDVLARPDGALANLQTLRDRALDRMYAALKADGTAAQRRYLDDLARSRDQTRSLSGELLSMLDMIRSDRDDQALAAVALIRMNVSPVVAIRIDFGGDNHADAELRQFEVPQHATGVAKLAELMALLKQHQLEDKVTFAMYNVFGRTLKKKGLAGRDHWGSHHATVVIGKGVRAGVVGGLEPQAGDYYATSIDAATGRGVPGDGGDVKFGQTLAAMGKTLGAAVGIAGEALDADITSGKVVAGALA